MTSIRARFRCHSCRCPVYATPGDPCLYCGGPLTPDGPPPDSVRCKRCGPVRPVETILTFANGDTHRRADCPNCGKFVRYLPRHK